MTTVADAIPLDEVELPFLDDTTDEYVQDPFRVIQALRDADERGGRLLRSQRGIEVAVYDTGREVLSDPRIVNPDAAHFASLGAGPLLLQYLSTGKLTALHGERHANHRRMLTPPLTAATVAGQIGMYHEAADQLIGAFVNKGEADLVADFSHTYPIEILCRALGVPTEDVPIFEKATLDFALVNSFPLEPHVARIEAALQGLSDYVADLLEQRKGSDGDDFIDNLLGYEREGRMEHLEVVWSLVTLLQAAHFTTRNQTVSIVRALLESDTWDDVVADPSLVPAAVEEGMRYYPVVLGIQRVVEADDVVLDGVALPRGTMVRWNPMGCSRDPEKFEDPYKFDLSRPVERRIPFGWGLHKCLGQHMARADMEVAIEVLTQRLKSPKILDSPIRMQRTGALWGPASLKLSFGS